MFSSSADDNAGEGSNDARMVAIMKTIGGLF